MFSMISIPTIRALPVLSVLDGIKASFIEFAEAIYGSVLSLFVKWTSFRGILTETYGILPRYVREDGKYVLKHGAVSGLLRVGQSYGAALALVFLLVAMVDIYMQEKMSIETFVKPFLQYLATVVLMLNCEKLVAVFWNFGILFQQSIAKVDEIELVKEFVVDFKKENVSIGLAIGLIVGAIILLLICLILGAIIKICAYIANFSRLIEAAVRAIGFPIAIGISVDTNLRQGAVRYLKKFFAVALQGGIFVAISLIYGLSCAAVLNNGAEGFATYFSDQTAEGYDALTGYSWNQGEGAAGSSNTKDNVTAPELVFNLAEGVTAFIFSILGSIIPLMGLALASILVLFKSGQICNDIVGA